MKRPALLLALVALVAATIALLAVGSPGQAPPERATDGEPAPGAKKADERIAKNAEGSDHVGNGGGAGDPSGSRETGGAAGAGRAERQVDDAVGQALAATAAGRRQDCHLYLKGTCADGQSSVDPTALGARAAQVRVARVKVSGKKATAELLGGGEFLLRRQSGRWRIAGFKAPAGGRAPVK